MFIPTRWTRAIKVAMIAVGLAGIWQTGASSVHADAVHTVKTGDTFFLLSKKYGVDMDLLMKANPTVSPNNMTQGKKLVVPGVMETAAIHITNLKVFTTDRLVEAWGKKFNYTDTLNVKASAYSSAGNDNGKWGAVDYFGNPLKLGTISVDPKIIPMGTKVLVTGHSHPNLPKNAFVAVASDQGGAIKGNRIDIFIPGTLQSVMKFGFQDITLYILDK